MLALRLKPELEERLTKLALKTGRTKTFYATKAIEQQLDNIEDYYLAERHIMNGLQKAKRLILLMGSLTDVHN